MVLPRRGTRASRASAPEAGPAPGSAPGSEPPSAPGACPGPPPAPASGSPAPPTGTSLLLGAARHSAGRTLAVFLCSAASAAASLAAPALLGRTLDLLLGRDDSADFWLTVCAVVITAEVLLDAVVAWLSGTVAARSTAWLRVRGLRAVLDARPEDGARFSPGDLTTRLSANATEAGNAPVTVAALAASLLAPAGALVALFLIDVWTAVAFLVGLPLLVLVLRAFTRDSSESVARYQRVQSDLAARLLEALGGARTIAAAGAEGRERARILAPLAELSAQGRRMWLVHGRAVARGGVLMPLLTTAVLAVGGLRVAAGRISVGELLAVSRYAALAAGVGAVAGLLGTLVRSRSAARRTAGPAALPALAYGAGSLPPDGPGTLELRGVTVVREGRALLSDVELRIPGGASAAVVGRSGAGKSMLAAVAGRLTDPDEGEVLLDGVRLETVARDPLRREVGYAFERPVLFGDTITEALADGPGRIPESVVRSAARAASADAFVRLLPRGYATPPGRAPLSGGELQRLGLARAFARAGRLLILDDATSSLDTVTERQVERSLARRVRPGTRLVVAHRLSSAARADLVIWLENGRVRAVGPHTELWRDPEYRGIFTTPGPAADRDRAEGAARADGGARAEGRARQEREGGSRDRDRGRGRGRGRAPASAAGPRPDPASAPVPGTAGRPAPATDRTEP
ncbi:ABC transporter transmembrane domain-containing protein [Streptomyces sp. NRRL F-5135]|uniref:ABC transporter transmembrane domain-containing protein n=1 Tax=Streptomyces sp. NRRL F-5135 TaxID=1463858 RepID=UPI00099BF220|nr:ABC transporter ATP-binding protein [Streptomyces sp. NRRL F-5135]